VTEVLLCVCGLFGETVIIFKMVNVTLSKNWVFNLYFNFKSAEGREQAETKRNEGLIYMKKILERMSCFSVIVRDEHESSLLLRGYMHLNNPCTREYIKRVLGKYSNCRMTNLGDVVYLLKIFNIDKDISVTGELHSNGRKKDDANWVLKMASDKGNDFERGKAVSDAIVEDTTTSASMSTSL
jgi:hypothetical protein